MVPFLLITLSPPEISPSSDEPLFLNVVGVVTVDESLPDTQSNVCYKSWCLLWIAGSETLLC